MTLRANHLTIARILLLPLPCWLLYQGQWERMLALAIFALLGLTDYFDGLLARRQGATALGKLLDPIADKIFVASMAVPLVDLGILPLWMVWLILGREYLVTELRRELSAVNKRLPVTELAKLKTTIQMTGFGLMVMTDTFPGKEVTIAFLSGALVSTVVLAITIFLRFGEFTFRMKAALGFMSAGLLAALFLPAARVIFLYGVVIIGITLLSGAGYVAQGFPVVLKKGIGEVVRIIMALSVPLVPLAFLGVLDPRLHLVVLLILCVEFVGQGVDTWVMQRSGRIEGGWRPFVAGGLTVAAYALAFSHPRWRTGTAAALFVLSLSVVDLGFILFMQIRDCIGR